MTSAALKSAGTRGPGRRAGRRKTAVLEAACRVIADRGADATRFADVAAESGVPVSTLQYYFGSREDMLVAAFRHASGAEITALEAEIAALDDPWERLERIVTRALRGYQPDAPDAGRLWIESWHFGIRDAEMRADTLQDYADWRRLVADAVRLGRQQGSFGRAHSPEQVAVLAIALVDGMGVPLALSDPDITVAGAVQDALAALRGLLLTQGQAASGTPRPPAAGQLSRRYGSVLAVRPTDRWRTGIADEQREVAAGKLDEECAVMALLHPASLLTRTDQVLFEFEADADAFFWPSDETVFGAIESAVLALNAVNDEHNGTGYETGERDELCQYIEETLEEAGIDVEALAARRGLTRHEITDRWRSW